MQELSSAAVHLHDISDFTVHSALKKELFISIKLTKHLKTVLFFTITPAWIITPSKNSHLGHDQDYFQEVKLFLTREMNYPE